MVCERSHVEVCRSRICPLVVLPPLRVTKSSASHAKLRKQKQKNHICFIDWRLKSDPHSFCAYCWELFTRPCWLMQRVWKCGLFLGSWFPVIMMHNEMEAHKVGYSMFLNVSMHIPFNRAVNTRYKIHRIYVRLSPYFSHSSVLPCGHEPSSISHANKWFQSIPTPTGWKSRAEEPNREIWDHICQNALEECCEPQVLPAWKNVWPENAYKTWFKKL